MPIIYDKRALARHIEHRHRRESYWKRCEERGWVRGTSSKGKCYYSPTTAILDGREKMTHINVDGDFMTSGTRFVKSLRKNWNVSKAQEGRILGQAQEVGLEWWNHSEYRGQCGDPWVKKGEWHTGFSKAGKLMLVFDGYRTMGGEQRKGVSQRIYLSKKQVEIDV